MNHATTNSQFPPSCNYSSVDRIQPHASAITLHAKETCLVTCSYCSADQVRNFFFFLSVAIAICNNTGYFGFLKYKYHFEFSMTYLRCELQKAAMKVILSIDSYCGYENCCDEDHINMLICWYQIHVFSKYLCNYSHLLRLSFQ